MIINLGDAPFKAFIKVTYPNGTCTVSLGDKSFTHSGGGTHTFTVNKKGTWTVKATSASGLSETTTVSITYNGQVANVTLTIWRGELYNAGNEYSDFTGGWVKYSNGSLTKTSSYMVYNSNNEDCVIGTNNAIDLTNYTSYNMSLTYITGSWSLNMVVIWDSATLAKSQTGNTGTYSLDISGFNGKYYLGFGTGWGAGDQEIRITKAWLS